jgi:hypothetical protein
VELIDNFIMDESMTSHCARSVFFALNACVIVLVCSSAAVRAADDPCQTLGKLLGDRVQVIQRIQAFKDKKPTADEACVTFKSLAKLNLKSVAAIERDGAWCRAPDGLAENFKSQQSQIELGQTNACKAAADQKKAQSNGAGAPRTPFGGADDVVGGAMKLPQGAL